MNLLTQGSSALVKRLPIHRPRDTLIKKLLYLNAGVFAFYTISSGPRKVNMQKVYTSGPVSTYESLFFMHFTHTNFFQLLFTSTVFYTIGNYHIGAYGAQHFIRLFAASAIGGSLLTLAGLKSGSLTSHQAGSMAPAAGLITYNIFRNPGWFKAFLRPVPLLFALALYGAFWGDRCTFGGMSVGYLAFLFGI